MVCGGWSKTVHLSLNGYVVMLVINKSDWSTYLIGQLAGFYILFRIMPSSI